MAVGKAQDTAQLVCAHPHGHFYHQLAAGWFELSALTRKRVAPPEKSFDGSIRNVSLAETVGIGVAYQVFIDYPVAGPGAIGVRFKVVTRAVAVKAEARVNSQRWFAIIELCILWSDQRNRRLVVAPEIPKAGKTIARTTLLAHLTTKKRSRGNVPNQLLTKGMSEWYDAVSTQQISYC